MYILSQIKISASLDRDWLTFSITCITTALTGVYVYFTFQLVRESLRSRADSASPTVVVYRQSTERTQDEIWHVFAVQLFGIVPALVTPVDSLQAGTWAVPNRRLLTANDRENIITLEWKYNDIFCGNVKLLIRTQSLDERVSETFHFDVVCSIGDSTGKGLEGADHLRMALTSTRTYRL
jgi:hypothetical protein